MGTRNIVQEEICKLLEQILKSQDYKKYHNKPGLKEILKTIVKHYPEVDSQFRKAWKHIGLYKESHRISKRAAEIIDNDGSWEDLHYEHITPVSYTIKELIELEEPTIESIKEIMNQTEVIILSKEEAKILDGSSSKKYPLEGECVSGLGQKSGHNRENRIKALKDIEFEFDERYKNNQLK
jgi:hypothetical protein